MLEIRPLPMGEVTLNAGAKASRRNNAAPSRDRRGCDSRALPNSQAYPRPKTRCSAATSRFSRNTDAAPPAAPGRHVPAPAARRTMNARAGRPRRRRQAMIALAVTGPTWGSVSSNAWSARLRSTRAVGAAVPDGGTAGTGAPAAGAPGPTTICSPSTSTRARLREVRSTPSRAPPACSRASTTRAPAFEDDDAGATNASGHVDRDLDAGPGRRALVSSLARCPLRRLPPLRPGGRRGIRGGTDRRAGSTSDDLLHRHGHRGRGVASHDPPAGHGETGGDQHRHRSQLCCAEADPTAQGCPHQVARRQARRAASDATPRHGERGRRRPTRVSECLRRLVSEVVVVPSVKSPARPWARWRAVVEE